MTNQEAVHPHEKLLILAGVLTVFGLGIGIVYVLWSTPYTMVAFLGLGQAAIFAGGVIFLSVVLLDVKSRLQSVVEKKFRAGETIFRQGEFPDRLYLIGQGEAEVIRETPGGGEVPLARLEPGEFFGEMGILSNTPRSATVRAATELETLSIHRSYLGPIFSYLPSWQKKIREDFAQRSAMNQGVLGEEERADAP
jgi:CRP-like cAMP-binding protein